MDDLVRPLLARSESCTVKELWNGHNYDQVGKS